MGPQLVCIYSLSGSLLIFNEWLYFYTEHNPRIEFEMKQKDDLRIPQPHSTKQGNDCKWPIATEDVLFKIDVPFFRF